VGAVPEFVQSNGRDCQARTHRPCPISVTSYGGWSVAQYCDADVCV
jgi:hypothetical protein